MVLLACIVMNASAQFSNSGSKDATVGDNSGWSAVYIEWNPSNLAFSGNKREKVDFYGSFNGFSLGFSKAVLLTSKIPLFVETGLAGQYSCKSETNEHSYCEESTKFSMLSLKVPVNIMYKFDIPNSTVSLIPFAGVTLRGNVWGKMKWEEYDYDWDERDDYSSSLFDNDDMQYLVGYHLLDDEYNYRDIDFAWKRIQIGWQIGLKTIIAEKFIVGASYGTDFNKTAPNYKINTGTILLGYSF